MSRVFVLPGPGDLSQSYGVPWETRHPLVRAAGATSFILGDAQDLAARAIRDHRLVLQASN